MTHPIEPILSAEEVTIVHPYSESEIQIPTFGGTRLIAEQIEYLRENGKTVRVISLASIGSLTSFLYRIQENLRNKENERTRNSQGRYDNSERSRWSLNLIQVLINEYSAKIDFLYRYLISKIVESLGDRSIIIYHYPYGSRYFASLARKKGIKFILYEHNIEWKFFEERLGAELISRMLVTKAKRIEENSIRSADLVAFASDKDRSSMRDDKEIRIMISWLPIRKCQSIGITANIPAQIKDKIKGRSVAGFVGTNFAPNIAAVENLLELARISSDSIVFLVMGSVSKAFDHRYDLPENVIFTGYVQDLDSYLSQCDMFINPKTTSDTGVETKMFDYMKFGKPILSTAIGARGFENESNVHIMPIELMAKSILRTEAGGGSVGGE